jgi:NAD(P)-dependent dehydrogenase (short-subunit alcohol dehydrogenase family)
MRLVDKVALITQASDSFATAIAVGYAKEGANLYLQDFSDNRAKVTGIAERCKSEGRKVVTGIFDVTRGDQVAAMTKDLIKQFSRVDILVNAASNPVHGKVFDIKEEDFESAIMVRIKSYFLTSQHIGREMARLGKGKIINLTSIVGKIGSGGAIPWGAACGGVDSMTMAFAHALGSYGVHVNALARGATGSPGHYDRVSGGERLRRLPFGRLGKHEDVVGPAIFLATSDSDWVTGSVIYADGGYTSAAVTDDFHRPGPQEWPYKEV